MPSHKIKEASTGRYNRVRLNFRFQRMQNSRAVNTGSVPGCSVPTVVLFRHSPTNLGESEPRRTVPEKSRTAQLQGGWSFGAVFLPYPTLPGILTMILFRVKLFSTSPAPPQHPHRSLPPTNYLNSVLRGVGQNKFDVKSISQTR
ncbi:hypothetical protein BaRGS_00013440 [Batillaria attramentaria]|uniref:Uncharacterized protein n=1 Tax=Batillaria attramentaria TaxID=370345 RepID=A0ABD0L7J4_9CAEN